MMMRPIRALLLTATAALILGGTAAAPAAADTEPAAPEVAESAATPELFGQAVHKWCDYKATSDAPVYAAASTNADRKGTISSGKSFKSKCGADGLVDGGNYSACGGGSKWRVFTDDSFMRNYRYVPATCLNYMY